MWARVSTLQGSPERADEAIREVQERFVAADMPGRTGFLMLMDRTTGKAIGISFWESEDALRQSEGQADQIRQTTADASGAQVVSVERYEVAIDER